MSNYSGIIKYSGSSFHYSYSEEKHELEITGNKTKINEWYSENENKWIELKSFDFPKLILKIDREKYTGRRGTYNYSVDDCFVILDFNDGKKDEIHRITYQSEVLDFFYKPKNHLRNVVNGIRSFMGANCSSKVKKHTFKLGDKDIDFFFHETVERRPYDAEDIKVHNTLYIQCKESLSYDETIIINTIVKRFLSFVSNNRSANIRKIGINQYNYREKSSYTYGHYATKDSEKRITYTNETLTYLDIAQNIERLFEAIVKNDICFISLFQYEQGEISTVDIMNICAAFENQFKITYPNYRSKGLEQAKADIVEAITKLITEKKKSGKNIDSYEEILQSVSRYKDTLLHKLEYAFNDFRKFVERYTDSPDFYLGKNYDSIPGVIKTARNKLDHGDKKNEVFTHELYATITVRTVVYYMILRSIGVSGKRLAKCVGKLFNIPLIIE